METKRQYPYDVEAVADGTDPEMVSIEQLQHLVQLLDRSDVSEVEVTRAEAGTRLVLRKIVATEGNVQGSYQHIASEGSEVVADEAVVENKQQAIVAPLVGVFHPWAKPRGKALVAVGDRVKVGQLVGAIQSLNIIYEVESTISGSVAEILVQDGQPVEYGQALMTIESGEEA